MSRPASVKSTSSPFVRRTDKGGSKPIELDYDRLDRSENHNFNSQLNLIELQNLRRELNAAEARGAHSKVKKLRREINRQLEQGLYIQGTFCGTCANVLHRCRCKGLDKIITPSRKKRIEKAQKEAAATAIVHDILANIFNSRKK
jgi:hypothetical protein